MGVERTPIGFEAAKQEAEGFIASEFAKDAERRQKKEAETALEEPGLDWLWKLGEK